MLSLKQCESALFLDDELNLLQVGKAKKTTELVDPSTDPAVIRTKKLKLEHLKLVESMQSHPVIHSLLSMTLTLDQAKVVLTMLDTIQNTKNPKLLSQFDPNDTSQDIPRTETVFLTASRGRGKTVGLALAVCGALLLKSSNIFVSALSAQNLNVLFSFIETGLTRLNYKKNLDFHLKADKDGNTIQLELFLKNQSGDSNQKQLLRRSVNYISPLKYSNSTLQSCELLVIDEAASIPLNLVKGLILGGNYPSFISSTVHGYEGTGRSLSLKLVQNLRAANSGLNFGKTNKKVFRMIREIKMEIPIRYGLQDR